MQIYPFSGLFSRAMRVAVVAALALALPETSRATAYYYAILDQPHTVSKWQYAITTSDPVGPTNCLNHGMSYYAYINEANTPPQIVTIGPPFSGSVSRTRYFTACYDKGHYVIVKMTLSLSSCAMWVCTAKRNYQMLNNAGGPYGFEFDFFGSVGVTNELRVSLPDYP